MYRFPNYNLDLDLNPNFNPGPTRNLHLKSAPNIFRNLRMQFTIIFTLNMRKKRYPAATNDTMLLRFKACSQSGAKEFTELLYGTLRCGMLDLVFTESFLSTTSVLKCKRRSE